MNALSQDSFIPEGSLSGFPSISAAEENVKAVNQASDAKKLRIEQQENLEKAFHQLLKSLLGDNLFEPKTDDAENFRRRTLAMLDNASSLSHSDKMVSVDFDGGKKSIHATAKQVVFTSASPKKDFTMDDAIRMAIIASQNKTLLAQGVKLEGTAKQQAMLQKAIESLNETLPQGLHLSIKNPVSKLRITFAEKANIQSFVKEHAIKEDIEEKPVEPATSMPVQTKDQRQEERIILTSLQKILNEQTLSELKSKDRLFATRGSNTGHNVYQVAQTAKLPSGETANLTAFYIVKDGKPVIAALKKNDEVILRHNDIYLKSDIHHPKHVSFAKVAEPETPIVKAKFDNPIDANVSTVTYGDGLAGGFSSAVDHHAAEVARSAARAAAAVDAGNHKVNGPRPTNP